MKRDYIMLSAFVAGGVVSALGYLGWLPAWLLPVTVDALFLGPLTLWWLLT